MSQPMAHLVVADAPFQPLVCAPASTSVADIAALLLESHAGIVVIGLDPLVAVSERDVVAAMAAGVDPNAAVTELVLSRPVVAAEWRPLLDVLRELFASEARSAIVIDRAGHPVGLLPMVLVVDVLFGGPAWLGALRLALHIEGWTP